MLKRYIRPVSVVLLMSFCLLNFTIPNAQAKMVSTGDVIAEQQAAGHRTQVAGFLAREDVQEILTQLGVDPAEAQQRVASLSDNELAEISMSIEQLPAGGDGLGAIVGAAVLIFLVLLITDIIGWTHVFPFVNHPR